MKKFISFKDLAAKQALISFMDASDVEKFNTYMKQAARVSSKHSQKAHSTASTTYLTR